MWGDRADVSVGKMDSFAITEGVAAQERQENLPDSISSKLSEETNKFQRAIAAWRGRISV